MTLAEVKSMYPSDYKFIGFGERNFGEEPETVFVMAPSEWCVALYEGSWNWLNGEDYEYNLTDVTAEYIEGIDAGLTADDLFEDFMDGGMEMRYI